MVRLLSMELPGDRQIQCGSIVGTALGGGAFFARWSMFEDDAVLLGAVAFTVVAVLACVEAPPVRRRLMVDVAVVRCAAVWIAACSTYVFLGLFWAVQSCAVALGGLAVIRYVGKQAAAGKGMLIAAAGVASFGAADHLQW